MFCKPSKNYFQTRTNQLKEYGPKFMQTRGPETAVRYILITTIHSRYHSSNAKKSFPFARYSRLLHTHYHGPTVQYVSTPLALPCHS